MKVGGRPFVGAQILSGDFGIVAGGAKHNGRSGSPVWKPVGKQMVNLFQFARITDWLNLEPQVVSLDTAGEQFQVSACLRFEVRQDLLAYILFGRGGKARDGREVHALFLAEFPDEPAGVQIVRSKIVSPFGKAMGLVEHPAANLSLGNRCGKGAVAELFRRDIEQRNIPQANPPQDVAPFRRRKQPVERRGE